MKIALIGYGKMGRMVEKAALQRGHVIVARMHSSEWDMEALVDAEMCVEFTHPESVLQNIKKVADAKKPVVIGTTGWYSEIASVDAIVKECGIGALYGANFSVGIHLFLEILAHTCQVMNAFREYDVAGMDLHHNNKKDSPSGTALEIEKTLTRNMEHIEKVPFSSVRCGSIPGTHTILFDSPCDTISLTHQARNREGFAQGAIHAAEWLQNRKGLYTFSDCMAEASTIAEKNVS